MPPLSRLVIALLWIIACHHGATNRARYAPRPGGPVPMSSIDSILKDAPFDLAARLQSAPLLRTVVLPPNAREIRISDWFGMIAGSPVPYLSLIQNGSGATGSLGEMYGCGRERGGVKWCSRIVSNAPGLNWRSVANTLDSLGVWDLRERCETDGTHRTDSGQLMLQRLEGAAFSTYTCNTPSMRSGPVGRRASAIYGLLQELVRRHVSPPPSLQALQRTIELRMTFDRLQLNAIR
jgi:hypothetical protein